jgi:hypothetical protein
MKITSFPFFSVSVLLQPPWRILNRKASPLRVENTEQYFLGGRLRLQLNPREGFQNVLLVDEATTVTH